MMMKRQIIYMLCATASLSSCHIYKSYERPEDIHTDALYRDTVSPTDTLVSDTTNMGNLPWREVFLDPQLQALIEEGLANNTDLQNAMLQVKQAQASLLSSKLAFLPSLTLAPQGTISSLDYQKASQTYQIPVTASWELDIFGKLLNSKRGAKAALLQSEAYEQAVRSQIIANIANCYYTLLMLDKQLAISEETYQKWTESVKTMKDMKKAGMTNEAAVVQSEANCYMVAANIPDMQRSIRETENALSLLLGRVPQYIERSTLEAQVMPEELSAGIPLQLLSNRPDVKSAEMALASAYYVTNQARSAFYPQITLSGSAGWTNYAGTSIFNPAKVIASAIGSLTQPLFNRGAIIANYKISKAQQEQAKLTFQQTILNAGSEVSNALFMYQTSSEKETQRKGQVESLEKSVEYTQELMKIGSATYLEVLTAQQSLLSAQLSQVQDTFERMQAVINLYQALGGGRNDE